MTIQWLQQSQSVIERNHHDKNQQQSPQNKYHLWSHHQSTTPMGSYETGLVLQITWFTQKMLKCTTDWEGHGVVAVCSVYYNRRVTGSKLPQATVEQPWQDAHPQLHVRKATGKPPHSSLLSLFMLMCILIHYVCIIKYYLSHFKFIVVSCFLGTNSDTGCQRV